MEILLTYFKVYPRRADEKPGHLYYEAGTSTTQIGII
jgi:hypothetical protein